MKFKVGDIFVIKDLETVKDIMIEFEKYDQRLVEKAI